MTGDTLNMVIDFIKGFAYNYKFQVNGVIYCIHCMEPSIKGAEIVHSAGCLTVKANDILRRMDAEGL